MEFIIKNLKFLSETIDLEKLAKIFFIIIFILIILLRNLYNNKNNYINEETKFEKNYNYYKDYCNYRYNKFYKKVYNSKEINIKKNIEIVSFNSSVAICLIAKQENLYIKEFIEYYKNLGIKKIIIYDNNDLKNENFEIILKNEIKNGFVKIIDFRGLISPQIKAYNECYEKYKYEFDWIAFFDVDEFLFLNNCSNIIRFLSSPKFKKCSRIFNKLENLWR